MQEFETTFMRIFAPGIAALGVALATCAGISISVVEGRLSSSPYSFASAVLYGVFAIWAAPARRPPTR
jgi:hypothetical protein